MLDKVKVAQLEADCAGLAHHVQDMRARGETLPVLERTVEALPAILRLARTVVDADRAEVREVGGSLIASTFPAMCSLKAGDRVLILRADAAGAGEGVP